MPHLKCVNDFVIFNHSQISQLPQIDSDERNDSTVQCVNGPEHGAVASD
jgi:hypothetical protein